MSDDGYHLQCGEETRFDMIQRGDLVGPGCWHWRCRREDAEGNVSYGYILADALGKQPNPDTFEPDWDLSRR